ncbi:YkgJ family cysteine cluster protein [Carboxylicivirga linearis]|uniref:YkgJ family cysteine cluster protein n=1 Tax=Carboxylicivirga linearis TaxID=1628157 RepID=A0ABS5JV73_9BACT|nr:YkgJ family cysteine cluster protein [Carboxylicivirga linearis]MBS2098728.1 YkgJ family cysteine cluster protein [Carboxylicivirga linearis]
MAIDLNKLKVDAQNKSKENKVFLTRLKKKKPKDLDENAQDLHHQVFEYTNCLECANCCKSISPIVIDRDIDRLAKHLRIKPSAVIDQYLHLDEDGDYVFNETPCPFLMPDNYCMVYESRPRACREYPHTDRKRFFQISSLTYKNTFVCPAVFDVVEGLKVIYD